MCYFAFSDNEADDHLQEPEHVLRHSATGDEDVGQKLITNYRYFKGSSDNNLFDKDSKPIIYYINKDSFDNDLIITSMKLVLKQCLGRKKDDVVLLCNNLHEVNLVTLALDELKENTVRYIPYLQKFYPTSEFKQSIIDQIKPGSILISDYRSYRGCKASHSITITDFSKPSNTIVEMTSRTVAYLDIIVFPQIEASTSINPIESALTKWNKHGLVEHITVEVYKEAGKEDAKDEEIIFHLNRSTYSTLIIEKSIKDAPSRDDEKKNIEDAR